MNRKQLMYQANVFLGNLIHIKMLEFGIMIVKNNYRRNEKFNKTLS